MMMTPLLVVRTLLLLLPPLVVRTLLLLLPPLVVVVVRTLLLLLPLSFLVLPERDFATLSLIQALLITHTVHTRHRGRPKEEKR